MTGTFTESIVEDAALAWLESLGYALLYVPDIAAGELGAERTGPGFRAVVLEGRLCQALVRLNPHLPPAALRDTLLPKLISGELRTIPLSRSPGCQEGRC